MAQVLYLSILFKVLSVKFSKKYVILKVLEVVLQRINGCNFTKNLIPALKMLHSMKFFPERCCIRPSSRQNHTRGLSKFGYCEGRLGPIRCRKLRVLYQFFSKNVVFRPPNPFEKHENRSKNILPWLCISCAILGLLRTHSTDS